MRRKRDFDLGSLSTSVESVFFLRADFLHVSEARFCHGRLSAKCGSMVFVGRTFRKARKRDFSLGKFSANCGRLLLSRAVFRKVRKHGFVAGSFPQSAEAWVCCGLFFAPCGNVCSDGRCGVLGAQPLGEGVAEAPQGLERGGDFPPRRLHHADFPRPAFHSSRLMKR